MDHTSIDPAALTLGSTVGVPIRFTKSHEAVIVEIVDLEAFERIESNLNRALETMGLCLEPLGFIHDGLVQYRVSVIDPKSIRAEALNSEAIKSTLAAMIGRARRSDDAVISTVGTATDIADDGTLAGPNPSEGAPARGTCNSSLGEVERYNGTPLLTDTVASPPDASSPGDDTDTERLRSLIQQGPDLITVNGDPMQWASALALPCAGEDEKNRPVTCLATGTEHHLWDLNNNRIRLLRSNKTIGVGATIEIRKVQTERVLVVTLSNQSALGFDRTEVQD